MEKCPAYVSIDTAVAEVETCDTAGYEIPSVVALHGTVQMQPCPAYKSTWS